MVSPLGPNACTWTVWRAPALTSRESGTIATLATPGPPGPFGAPGDRASPPPQAKSETTHRLTTVNWDPRQKGNPAIPVPSWASVRRLDWRGVAVGPR